MGIKFGTPTWIMTQRPKRYFSNDRKPTPTESRYVYNYEMGFKSVLDGDTSRSSSKAF